MSTCLFFHAHPDDESLLTAGTMARLAAEGHRVVLVVATAGEAGLAADRSVLGRTRTAELHASAAALGCARVEVLGYRDSGLNGDAPDGFASAPVWEAAERLAQLLKEEDVRLLTIYDAAGGYGHPDHVQVHRVGVEAARLAGTPVVLAATLDRDLLLRFIRPLSRLLPWDLSSWEHAYTPRAQITHRVDVRPHLDAKRASLAAHASQAGGAPVRTLRAILWLPRPLFRRFFGTEYYRSHPVRP